MNNIRENFAENLKYHMHEKNLTQENFAKMIGVDQGTVSTWLLKRSEPKLSNVYAIIKCFEITFEDLVE